MNSQNCEQTELWKRAFLQNLESVKFYADSGRFLQNPREVAQIVSGQNEQSMRVEKQTLKKIRALHFPDKLRSGCGKPNQRKWGPRLSGKESGMSSRTPSLRVLCKRGFRNQSRAPFPKVREPHFLWLVCRSYSRQNSTVTKGGGLHQGAGVVVFPRAELPSLNHGPPPPPREYHDPPPPRTAGIPWPPPSYLSAPPGMGIPVALGNIRPWEYHDPSPWFSRPPFVSAEKRPRRWDYRTAQCPSTQPAADASCTIDDSILAIFITGAATLEGPIRKFLKNFLMLLTAFTNAPKPTTFTEKQLFVRKQSKKCYFCQKKNCFWAFLDKKEQIHWKKNYGPNALKNENLSKMCLHDCFSGF